MIDVRSHAPRLSQKKQTSRSHAPRGNAYLLIFREIGIWVPTQYPKGIKAWEPELLRQPRTVWERENTEFNLRNQSTVMLLHFTKMHGLGNDFMVIDMVSQNVRLPPEKIRRLADRRFGVGFDQLLLVEPPTNPDMDFRYRIFNADGSEVEQCGNGARCFAKFVRDKRLIGRDRIRVQTAGGNIELTIEDNGDVTVDMGLPRLEPEQIPYTADEREETYLMEVDDDIIEMSAVSMGNPHCVYVVDDTQTAPVEKWGPLIEAHPDFPRKCNAGFMQIVSREEINLRVFERGVGETMACGTGACAAVVAGRLRGLLDAHVKVNLPGGSLSIYWAGESSPVMMTGPATRVYEGYTRL